MRLTCQLGLPRLPIEQREKIADGHKVTPADFRQRYRDYAARRVENWVPTFSAWGLSVIGKTLA